MNKRGLSTIIVTILIVLLALGAVALTWPFIQDLISGTSGTANLQAKCIKTEAKPTRCSVNLTSNLSEVTIQLSKEGATRVLAIIKDQAGGSKPSNETDAPAVLGTVKISNINIANLDKSTVLEAYAAAIVTDGQANSLTCQESVTSVVCSTS